MKYLRIVKWLVVTLLVLFLVGFLHYTLPGRDVVKIVGTDVKRMDIDSSSWFWANVDAGTNPNTTTRDVRFVNAAWPDGSPRVYRNEDTDWSWPPYFKFDSGNLIAEAQALAKEEGDVWVAVTHYGWRNKVASIFPNIIKIKRVEGPDVMLIPWFNIIFFILLFGILFWFYRSTKRLRNKLTRKPKQEVISSEE